MATKAQTKDFVMYWLKEAHGPDYTTYPSHAIRFAKECGIDLLKKDYPHQFITIALENTRHLGKLVNTIQGLEYQYIKEAIVSIENYSSVGENLHVHILKKGIYNKTKLIRDMSRKFKVAPNFINVKKGTNESDYRNRLNYIKGDKTDEDKKENSIKDQIWRKENNIQDVYKL